MSLCLHVRQQPTKHEYKLSIAKQVVSMNFKDIPCLFHTFSLHAHSQTLLIAAVLAAIALAFVHQALFVIPAGVAQIFAHSSFEETFATLTAVHSIVFPCKMQNFKNKGKRLEANGKTKQNQSKRSQTFLTMPEILFAAFRKQSKSDSAR